MKKPKLSKSMSVKAFENGYWYAVELKAFAVSLGVPSASKLRKDELEKAICSFLKTGKIKSSVSRALSYKGIKDVERGLRLGLPIVRYTNDKETKAFIVREAKKMVSDFKEKSGARYRLNRWREAQLSKGRRITYKDLVLEYVRLNRTSGRFAQIPTGRYINFLSDFLAAEKNATREKAIKTWKTLKKLDIPKNYRAWKQYKKKHRTA